jgi:multiple sugar transport system permease protein
MMISALRRREAVWGVVCAAPAVLGFLLWQLGPILASLALAFTNWDIASSPGWVGLGNFARLLGSDELFWQSLKVTLLYSAGSVPLSIVVAFGLAVLLNQPIRARAVFRTIFYLPSIVPLVAGSILWMWIFNPDIGLLNSLLRPLGFPKLLWIFDAGTVIPSLILMSLWSVGPMMIIFLAGLQGVPRHLYDAVAVDGGGTWHQLRHVTVPMVTPTILFNLVVSIIGAMQTFTQAYVMTNGGPNNASLFYVFYIWRSAFQDGHVGYASALAWVLFVIIAALSLGVLRSARGWVYYEGEDA